MVKQFVKKINPAGIASRLTYVTYRENVEPITPYLTLKFAPTPVIRGLVKLIQNDVDKVAPQLKPLVLKTMEEMYNRKFSYESRAFRHVYKVTSVLTVLFKVPQEKATKREFIEKAIAMVKFGDLNRNDIEELLQMSQMEQPEEKQVEQQTTETKEELPFE